MRIKKEKIKLDNNELRIVLYALNDYRSLLIAEKKYTDAVDDVLIKLNNKMKVDKYELGVIINALYENRKELVNNNQDSSEIDNLILRLLEIYDILK